MILENIIPKQLTNHLEEKANKILIKHNIKYPYEIDLEAIIHNNYKNIRVFYSNQDSKTIIKKNMAIIVINNNLNYREQHQELAEEFCHVRLHCGNQINYKYNIILDKQEQQAKRMSAYLLCPICMIKKLKFMEDTYLFNEELANYFNVTNDFMRYRLNLIFGQDLDLITYYKRRFYGYMPIE